MYLCVNVSIPLCFAFPEPSSSGTAKVEITLGVLSYVFQKRFSRLHQGDIHTSPWAEKCIAVSAIYPAAQQHQPRAPVHTDPISMA